MIARRYNLIQPHACLPPGRLLRLVALLLSTLLCSTPSSAEETGSLVNYQGTLADAAGLPVSGTVELVFSLYESASGGEPLWRERQTVTVSGGRFHVLLGATAPIPDRFLATPRWIGVAVATQEEQPGRQRIMTVRPDPEKGRCPDDMVDLGDYCIDRHTNTTGMSWYDAADSCDAQGKRLCSNDEWLSACDGSPVNGVDDLPGRQPQWVDRWVFETSTQPFADVERGYFRCSSISHPWSDYRPLGKKWFRCCR